MANYCDNFLCVEGNPDTLKSILEFVRSDSNLFDFDKIVPMPAHIYQGPVGPKERELYGENNWYDWSLNNWGTKENSKYAEVHDTVIQFSTAWSPCDSVISTLAKMFPEMRFKYSFYETGMCFCGKRVYENGEIIFSYEGDFVENFFPDEDDEFALSDPLFPMKDSGVFEAVQDIENHNEFTCGKLYYREYVNSKISVMAEGRFVAAQNYKFEITPVLLSPALQVA